MKKAFIFCLMLLICALALPAYVLGETDTEKGVRDTVMKEEHVTDAAALVYGNKCVIALRTQGVLQKSEYTKLKRTLAEKITAAYPDITEIMITKNVRAFMEISKMKDMDDKERAERIDELINSLEHPEKRPLDKPEELRTILGN